MIVTFISQCEKKALDRTRRVLDAFSERIGSRTWQTVITYEGLNAVKKLLKKTATKNTAVACHRIRGQRHFELEWIVGNRNKFNETGRVPVNYTQKDILNSQWENDWRFLPLIKALAALAALFHDWGKASGWFQSKLNNISQKFIGDPIRHEWISCILFCVLVQNKTDEEWLTVLENGEIDEAFLSERIKNQLNEKQKNRFENLSPLADIIIWLILTHHRLPLTDEYGNWKNEKALSMKIVLNRITPCWGYRNKYDEKEYQRNLKNCCSFNKGFPSRSPQWSKQMKKWAGKAKACLPFLNEVIPEGAIRPIIFYARMCLMLGDYSYSSQDMDAGWNGTLELYANTDPVTGKPKQKLDEHLLGVMKSALTIAHLLPLYENEPARAYDTKSLKKKSHGRFIWQDKAVDKINSWKKNSEGKKNPRGCYGFFAVNAAGTGCGKTIANAKVMRALSGDGESLRYILAVGLRTLTLQTGDEYRARIGLDGSEIAVLIGSKAVSELHSLDKLAADNGKEADEAYFGSESREALLDEDVEYESSILENELFTILKKKQEKAFYHAPVLVCTIDHIMAAVETRRGGRYMLPALRLMSSDIVIDEIDDFSGDDLVAIGRLIHLAGMLGRKVMISSATIPPDLAEGYFNAYQRGWRLFSKIRNAANSIGCAWIDEFGAKVETIYENDAAVFNLTFRHHHEKFINKRISELNKQEPRRKGVVIDCSELYPDDRGEPAHEYDSREKAYFEKIKHAVMDLHNRHHTIDEKSGKRVSFGVVRIANIEPCIESFEYLMNAAWPESVAPRLMAYHSRQVLLLRSGQERHLDEVLKRKEKKGETPAAFENLVIRRHLNGCAASDVIFIVVASPVEEIGRDHDFDWAVVEPSSYRSLIQLSGRILRHREICPRSPNVAVMQYCLKALKCGIGRPAYCRPGYEESNLFMLATHDIRKLMDEAALAERIDATPRIRRVEPLCPGARFADQEHFVMEKLLTSYQEAGPESLQGWLDQYWWMTALPQKLRPFRKTTPEEKLFLRYKNDAIDFIQKDDRGNAERVGGVYEIQFDNTHDETHERLWLKRDYKELLFTYFGKEEWLSPEKASLRYGEISLPVYDYPQAGFVYSDQYGLKKRVRI